MAKLDKMITFAYLKDECDLPEHNENDYYDHKIYRAQEVLRMLMGDAFYQDYLTKYKASTFSAAETSLFAYVKQFIAWQTYEFWTVTANYLPTRAGFRVHSETNSEAVSDVQMSIIIKDAKYQSQYYKELLVGYLKNHNTDFPLYQYCCDDKSGNGFHISAVVNKNTQPQPYGTNSSSHKCCR
jgi:hypothetical protein